MSISDQRGPGSSLPPDLPEEPSLLADHFTAQALGNYDEAIQAAKALAIVATELGDRGWLARATVALQILRRRSGAKNPYKQGFSKPRRAGTPAGRPQP